MKSKKFILEIIINILGPWLVYHFSYHQLGEVNGLILSMLPPFAWSIFQFIKERKLDVLSILVLSGIILSLILTLLGGSTKWILLRESLLTGFTGVVFLSSLFWRKPIIYLLTLATMERNSKERADSFQKAWESKSKLARFMNALTLFWGVGLVLECLVRIYLLHLFSVEQFLIVGPTVGYILYGVLTLITVIWVRWYKSRNAKEENVPS